MYELIEKSKKGNVEAFTNIIRNMDKDLYKIAKTRLQNEDDISDAIQETMIIAFKSIKKLKHNEFLKTWLIKILINNCNAIYRKQNKKEFSFEESKCENYIVDNSIKDIDDILNFDHIIKQLNFNERIVLNLCYGEGYTSKEISKIIGIKEPTIKSRILRAKNKIREIMKEENQNG